ncbi:pyridoxine 5'-phosphate synthase [Vampirovibrio chlorellavorus]|uniref:pyridoxine 5'-phosphate synthase n=1 Tax=Vampirovibrio chlorellavorus TaxID=758823 RepID=UPI0026EE3290|nr:pyridoxine 5'-phosphate synthase [Vampirovibrio chlorellavorus]
MALLGVNIDHVATLRNARGGSYPDPLTAALIAEAHGADGITAHLREDRRHIRDEDIKALKAQIKTRLNLEMANTPEMVEIALKAKPYMVTLVPERRQELTTEGGLDVVHYLDRLKDSTTQLQAAGIKVSLFIDPDLRQLEASRQTGAAIVEFHTGTYCEAFGGPEQPKTLHALMRAAEQAVAWGIEVNAGHGLNYENVQPVLAMPGLVELNIGHSIIAESVFTGLASAVSRMKALIS